MSNVYYLRPTRPRVMIEPKKPKEWPWWLIVMAGIFGLAASAVLCETLAALMLELPKGLL